MRAGTNNEYGTFCCLRDRKDGTQVVEHIGFVLYFFSETRITKSGWMDFLKFQIGGTGGEEPDTYNLLQGLELLSLAGQARL